MSHVALADVVRPSRLRQAFWYDLALIVGGSLLLTVSAQIAIPLPFSPVPVTGQTLVVLLIGATLGSRRGLACMLAYLGEGALGWPAFAGGKGGLAVLFGPTGGYLLGFAVAAYCTGWLAERGWDKSLKTSFAAMLLGNLVIYALGLAGLARFVGTGNLLALGLLPFLPGDFVKLVAGTLALPSGWRLVEEITHDRGKIQ